MGKNKTIREMTKDCRRDDCNIIDLGRTTTLMGWTQSYDKNGNPQNSDPNTITTTYKCTKCGQIWSIKT